MQTFNPKLILLDFDDIANPLLAGGQAWATYEVGRRLVEKGYKLLILSSRYPGFKDRIEEGMYYKHIGLGSPFLRLNNLVYILILPFFIKRHDGDLIVEYFTAPISTLLSPLFTKLPVVAVPAMFNAKEYSHKYHLPFHLIETFGSKLYKYFLPYTKDIDERMKRLNPQIKSKIVPNGVDDAFFKITHSSPEYILYLGRFDLAQKGIDLLLESYKLIEKEIRFPLVLAGYGPDGKRIREIIKKLDLRNKVKIIGPTYKDKKMKILERTLFVSFPSKHDDLPVFSLEALAAGQPLVTFDIPEFSIFNKRISYKAKPFSINSYAQCLLAASKDKLLNKKRASCRAFAKKYSWEKTASEYDSFFKKILNKQSVVN